MSLIADALKAAQKEKARRVPPPRAPQQQGYFPFRFGTRSSGEPIVSPLVIGIGVATAAIALTALVLIFAPTRKPDTQPPAVAQFLDSVPTTMVLETPGDPGQLVLLDSTAEDLTVPMGLEEYVDEPPVRSVSRPPAGSARSARSARSAPRTPVEDVEGSNDLPSIAAAPRVRSGSETGGRLQITVERPGQGSEGGGGLFEQGLAAQRRGDYPAAKNYYLQATFASSRNPEVYNNLGTVYRALRDLPAAEAAYRHATEVDSRFAPAWSNLGMVLAQAGRAQEAMAALQEAVRLDPSNSGAKVNLAIQLHAAGALADARRLLEDVLRVDPAMPEAHYELARALEKQNDRAGAVREYRIFLSTAGGRFAALEQAVRSRLVRLEQ
ncbi:MAG: tetratricopeptide repeat protein [Gemmatimonadota bacterium]|nr:tetratricopeptide repeat protein [Gemmatimonadota bacterium]